MGVPSSGLIAESFLQRTENSHLIHLTHKHKTVNYCLYADDILLIFGSNHTNIQKILDDFNPLTPNDPYSGRTAPLSSKRCILYIYSTNIDTEYFKHGIYSPFSSFQNAVCFIILMCLVPVLFTFYIQVC